MPKCAGVSGADVKIALIERHVALDPGVEIRAARSAQDVLVVEVHGGIIRLPDRPGLEVGLNRDALAWFKGTVAKVAPDMRMSVA